jgi:hypothetical protein
MYAANDCPKIVPMTFLFYKMFLQSKPLFPYHVFRIEISVLKFVNSSQAHLSKRFPYTFQDAADRLCGCLQSKEDFRQGITRLYSTNFWLIKTLKSMLSLMCF